MSSAFDRDQNSQQDFHFDCSRIYLLSSSSHLLFCIYLFTSIAFALKLSASVMIKQIFELSSMILFAMSIDQKKEIVVSKWNLKKKMLRACLKISIEILFYQREFIWELAWFRAWRSQSTFDIRSSCTYLLFKSNILVFVIYWFKHDSWHIRCIVNDCEWKCDESWCFCFERIDFLIRQKSQITIIKDIFL